MDTRLMSRLSRGLHTAEEIATLEYEILIALRWKLNGPTPLQFINYILELLPDSARQAALVLYKHSHFQAELAAGDYAYVPYLRQSTIAVASILNSLGGIQGTIHFHECSQIMLKISSVFHLDLDSPLLNAVRGRLRESFYKSSGYELSSAVQSPTQAIPLKSAATLEDSPTCVSKEPCALDDECMV